MGFIRYFLYFTLNVNVEMKHNEEKYEYDVIPGEYEVIPGESDIFDDTSSHKESWTKMDKLLMIFGCLCNFSDGTELDLPGL